MANVRHFRFVILLLSVLLAACGGGGGGGTSTSSVPPGDLTPLTNNRNATPSVSSLGAASVVDPNGVAFVAWVDNNSLGTVLDNGRTIKVRRSASGNSWDSAVVLAESVTGSYLNAPQIGVDGSGNVIVVWEYRESSSRSLHARRYTPAGGWETTATVLRAGASTSVRLYPQLAVAGNGDAMVVWRESDGLKSKPYTVTGGWATSVVPVDASTTAIYQDLAADGAGNFMFLWSSGSGVQARLYTAGSSWGSADTLNAEAGDTRFLRIGFDGNGNALAMWFHDGDATAARHWEIVVNRYVANSGWGTATRFSTLNAGNNANPYFRMAVDATGSALMMWDHYDGMTNVIQGNRYVPGVGWATTAVVAGSSGNDAYAGAVEIAVDAQGNGRVTWVGGEPVSADGHSAFCLSYDLGGSRSFMVSRSFSIASGWSAGTEQHSDNECLLSLGGFIYPVEAHIASNAAGDMVGVLEGTSFDRDLLAYRYH